MYPTNPFLQAHQEPVPPYSEQCLPIQPPISADINHLYQNIPPRSSQSFPYTVSQIPSSVPRSNNPFVNYNPNNPFSYVPDSSYGPFQNGSGVVQSISVQQRLPALSDSIPSSPLLDNTSSEVSPEEVKQIQCLFNDFESIVTRKQAQLLCPIPENIEDAKRLKQTLYRMIDCARSDSAYDDKDPAPQELLNKIQETMQTLQWVNGGKDVRVKITTGLSIKEARSILAFQERQLYKAIVETSQTHDSLHKDETPASAELLLQLENATYQLNRELMQKGKSEFYVLCEAPSTQEAKERLAQCDARLLKLLQPYEHQVSEEEPLRSSSFETNIYPQPLYPNLSNHSASYIYNPPTAYGDFDVVDPNPLIVEAQPGEDNWFQRQVDGIRNLLHSVLAKEELVTFREWLYDNGMGNWLDQCIIGLVKAPVRAVCNVLLLLLQLVDTLLLFIAHPIESCKKIGPSLLKIAKELGQPESLMKLGLQIMGTSMAVALLLGASPLHLGASVIGSTVFVTGLGLGTIRDYTQGKPIHHFFLQHAPNMAEHMFTGFCLGMISSMVEIVAKTAGLFSEAGVGFGPLSTNHVVIQDLAVPFAAHVLLATQGSAQVDSQQASENASIGSFDDKTLYELI